jgi:hypothetical protein
VFSYAFQLLFTTSLAEKSHSTIAQAASTLLSFKLFRIHPETTQHLTAECHFSMEVREQVFAWIEGF